MRRTIHVGIILSTVVALIGRADEQDNPPVLRGITNFVRVDDHLYRGAQPNSLGIQSLAHLGVRTIINLRMTNEVWSAEEAEAHALGITYTNVPMSGIGRPTDEQVLKVFSIIKNAPGPVFVHCQRGADRTGTIVACYRIEHDKWTSEQALKEAKQYGMSSLEIEMRKYVVDFAKSHKSD
jgi:uncharacterized protein (TIGR01244 family)